ncbi:hypothetical protein J3F83DRAFT_733829 [Trichoderma novae-zelandiae]
MGLCRRTPLFLLITLPALTYRWALKSYYITLNDGRSRLSMDSGSHRGAFFSSMGNCLPWLTRCLSLSFDAVSQSLSVQVRA